MLLAATADCQTGKGQQAQRGCSRLGDVQSGVAHGHYRSISAIKTCSKANVRVIALAEPDAVIILLK